MKRFFLRLFLYAALLWGAALPFAGSASAGSCCGGGAASALIVPGYGQAVLDLSFDAEVYDGFWNQSGRYIADPAGSSLRQYRLNTGYGRKLSDRWQVSVAVPYVWNDNRYSGMSSKGSGLGDMSINLWHLALQDMSAWRVRSLTDLVPSVSIGPSVLLPTGVSPFDDARSSFDITGRGFYRIDANLLMDKTIQPWSASIFLGYGTYIERPVNREYGKFVEPYNKRPGNRTSASASLSYNQYMGSGGDLLTYTISYAYVWEEDGSIDGNTDPASGFGRESVGGALAYSSTDRDWALRVSFMHSIQQDGWGRNFPASDIYSAGVRYVFR